MIYVDNYEGKLGRMIMCHMLSDNIEELHEFASKLGLKRSWFQNGSAPHYDLSKEKRAQALKLGAIELPIHIDGKPNPKWREVYNQAKLLKS